MAEILAIKPFATSEERCYNQRWARFRFPGDVKTIADLKLLPVWVHPDHLVSSARILLAGHSLKALGVAEAQKLLGVVSPQTLAGASDEAPVRDFMLPPSETVTPETSIRAAAELMAEHDLDFVPVVDKDRFVGMVTATMLLPQLGRTWDPLTGLAWSDLLREWGLERLREGREVSIVFLDLDDFGDYNKRFGHVVGDRVLQRTASLLKQGLDEERDVLVRYAGDEFAIGSVRSREEVNRLVEDIEERTAGMYVGESDQPVTLSIGVFGGRRSKERENVHFAATLDNLINLASKECMKSKAASKSARVLLSAEGETSHVQAPRAGELRITVVDVGADDRSSSALTPVMLSRGETIVSGVHSRAGMPLIESVVLATARALERLFPDLQFHLGEVRLIEPDDDERAVVVSARVGRGGIERESSSVRRVDRDLYIAAAEATVEAVVSAFPEGS